MCALFVARADAASSSAATPPARRVRHSNGTGQIMRAGAGPVERTHAQCSGVKLAIQPIGGRLARVVSRNLRSIRSWRHRKVALVAPCNAAITDATQELTLRTLHLNPDATFAESPSCKWTPLPPSSTTSKARPAGAP
jgi:hypothetical protein